MKDQKNLAFWDKPFVKGLSLSLITVPLIVLEVIARSRLRIPQTIDNSVASLYFFIIAISFSLAYYESLVRLDARFMKYKYKNAQNIEVRPGLIKLGKAVAALLYVLAVAGAITLRMVLTLR